MKKMMSLLVCVMLLWGCSEVKETAAPDGAEAPLETSTVSSSAPVDTAVPVSETVSAAERLLDEMTIEEMVGQLFLARCPGKNAETDLAVFHLGGYILFAEDLKGETPETLMQKLASYQSSAKIPLLIAVDEEGGTVCRVSRYLAFRCAPFASPRELYARGGLEKVLEAEKEKAELLSGLGINVNMAPVCDITTDPDAFMYSRSLGQSPEETSRFVTGILEIMDRQYLGSVLKHFPGYGNNTDTHTGIAVDNRKLEELETRDLIPFQAGIQAGCGAILVSHTIVNCLDPEYPASLSPAVHTYLRDTMGFDGVIITDDLVMEAITDLYGSGEAAVLAVLAGNDLLCATEYDIQYNAVLEAVQSGRISQEILRDRAGRILRWKERLGLLV